MLTYTNRLRPLVLPEYGRNIQKMVDSCIEIVDREERTRAANAIVQAMLALFPPTGDRNEYVRKLWDHVMIMSGFRLDIDMPVERLDPTVFSERPEPLAKPVTPNLQFPVYGVHIAKMVDKAVEMPEGEERDELVLLLAKQMKKAMLASNGDGVDDERIFKDLMHMSHGVIRLSTETTQLPEYRQAPSLNNKRKRRK